MSTDVARRADRPGNPWQPVQPAPQAIRVALATADRGSAQTQAAENSGRASSAAAQSCTDSIGFLGRSNRETVLRVHLYCRRILAAFDNSRLRHRAGTPWPVRYVNDMDSPQRHKSTEKSCTGGHWAGRWPTQPPLWPASVAVMTIDLEFISDRVGVIAGGRVADAHA